MSSEEFEKLDEIYKSLYDELKLMPERALRCHGGKQFVLLVMLTSANCLAVVVVNTSGDVFSAVKRLLCCFHRGEEEVGKDLR